MFKKNTAGQFIHIQGVDASTGGIKSGVTWTMRRCIDGTFAAGGATITEDGTTGWYKVALAQADTNGNNIGFNFTGTGAVPQTVNIITDGAAPDVNVTKVAGTTQTARDIGASVLVGDKTGFSLSTAGIAAIWDALLTGITTVGSIGKLIKDYLDAAITTRATPAQVNTEVVDALNTDTYTEPGQEAPPVSASLVKKIGYLYKFLRNKATQTATTLSIYADDGTTVDQKATTSDDSTTYIRGEIESGP